MTASDFRLTPAALVEIRERVRLRQSRHEIAQAIGCAPSTIDAICSRHGFELGGGDVRRKAFPIPVTGAAWAAIEREAGRRGTSAETLASRCLEAMAFDGLFSAVVDG